MMFDTDVVIDAMRLREPAMRAITDASTRQVPTAVLLEVFQGARNKRELAEMRAWFTTFRIAIVPLSASIGVRAAELLEKHALCDGLEGMDALIAATALEHDCELLSWNRKHFKHIAGLNLHIDK